MNTSSLNHRVQLVVILAGVSAAACASMFLSGGQTVDRDLSSHAVMSYRASSCVQLAGNRPLNAPQDLTWHLIREGRNPRLFERQSNGTGTLIENHWADSNGDHFFVRVQTNGWEYVIPGTPSLPAQRLVYIGVSTSNQNDIERPVGAPAVRCELASYGAAVARAATSPGATGTTVNATAAPVLVPSQPTAPPAAATPSPTAHATTSAEPVMGVSQVNQRISAIMGSDFTAGQHARAESGLLDLLVACGNTCGPAANATIWMNVGIVRGVGLHNQKRALDAFRLGLKQDRNAAPQTTYLDAPTLATFQKAYKELSHP